MQPCFQRNPLVEAAPLQDETLLFHAQTRAFCVLNRTAAFLWTCLAEPSSAERLAVQLGESFEGVVAEDALRDVQHTLQEMQSLELIVTVVS